METVNRIIDLLNSNLDEIKKFKFEKFKQFWIIDINTTKFVFTIEVSDTIKLQKETTFNQYKFDFADNDKEFKTYEEFEKYFLRKLEIIKADSETLVATYKGKKYICEVEVTSVDSDRQMGTETIYEITLNDEEGETIQVAEVSEYPMGAFSVFEKNDEVEISNQDIMQFFYEKPDEWNDNEY